MVNYFQKVQPSTNVIFQQLGGESVLLHLETEEYYTLDETGSRMWQLLSELGDVEPVVKHLQEEYDIDEATIKRDLTILIKKLAEEGLLDVVE
jgi:hypothetical protein